jgi:hypothetical protein
LFSHDESSLTTFAVVEFMHGTGARIELADMNDGFITRKDLIEDGIHPNNGGYRKMAAVWNAAIMKVQAAGFLRNPEKTGVADDEPDSRCEKVPGKADGPHLTQKGYGFDDGPYKHKGTKADISLGPFPMPEGMEKHHAFAQMVNAGGNPNPDYALDDHVIWQQFRFGFNAYVSINDGNGGFSKTATASIPLSCVSEDVRWGDVNGMPSNPPLRPDMLMIPNSRFSRRLYLRRAGRDTQSCSQPRTQWGQNKLQECQV